MSLLISNTMIRRAVGSTNFGTRSAPATDVDGTTWKTLLDMSTLSKQEEIWGITLTISGGWAGLCQVRIIDGSGNKIFPFRDYSEENTDFFSGVQWDFPSPVVVAATTGYKIQFRSSNAADGAGETCTLTELAIISKG